MTEKASDPAPSVLCGRLKLERFSTEADVDLRGLALSHGSAAAHQAQQRRDGGGDARPWRRRLRLRLRRWWDRVRDDLTQPEDLDAYRSPDGSAPVRSLNARHCRVGGVLRLPNSDGALDCADLAFATADRLEIPGRCLRGGCAALALDLNSVRADSARLIEPLPARVDVRDAAVGHWDIGADSAQSDAGDDREDKYLKFAQQSWPFAQTVYTRLEQDYREAGKHREADRFQAAMGWRLWRWSFVRPMLEARGRWKAVILLMLIVPAAIFSWRLSATWLEWLGWSYGLLLLAGAILALLSFLDPLKRASRFVLGALLVAPAQLVFGFGIRWWLPLLASAIVFVVLTLPLLSDCRNLVATDGKGAAAATPKAAERGEARSLFAVMGAGVDLPPRVVVRCAIPASGQNEPRNWDLGEAFWLALRYHVPVIGLDGFFHGEREEAVRPSGAAAFYDVFGQSGTTSWMTPLGYTRLIYLLSWILIPFSLIFLGARIQRRYRLQK